MPKNQPARRAAAGRRAVDAIGAKAAPRPASKKPAPKISAAKLDKRTATAGAALVGGLIAGIAGAVKSRRSSSESSQTPPAPAIPAVESPVGPDVPAPSVANYDAPGPVANTATPLAAPATGPDVLEDGGLDEEAEIAAAAAEAAAIGGPDPAYASADPSLLADDAERPLVESGEGEAEGMEQAEADLLDEVNDPYGPGAGMTDAERQINEVIESQDDPFAGETPDVVPPGTEDAGPANTQ